MDNTINNTIIPKSEKCSQSPAKSKKKHKTRRKNPSNGMESEVMPTSCKETPKRKLSFDNSQTSASDSLRRLSFDSFEGSAKRSKKRRNQKISTNDSNSVSQESGSEKELDAINNSPQNKFNSDSVKAESFCLKEMIEEYNDQAELDFNEEIAQKISSIQIVIPYEVHPSRCFENRICKTPSKEVMQKIKASGISMRVGKFNEKEDNIIRSNWKDFSKNYGFKNPLIFCNKVYWNRLPQDQRKNFVQFMAKRLPNRYLSAVYSRFLALFEERKRGHFSKEEDDLIRTEVASNHDNSYANLARVLHRNRLSVYKRAMVLKSVLSASDAQKGDGDYTQRVLEAIISATGCNNLKELQNIQKSNQVWLSAEKKSSIPHDTIRHVWESKLSSLLFARKPIYRSKIRLQILDILDTEKVKHWQDVHWNKLAEEFHGISGLFLYYKFKSLVRTEVPEEYRHSLRKCVKYLKKYWKPNVKTRKDKEYPRLKYKNGELIQYFSNTGND